MSLKARLFLWLLGMAAFALPGAFPAPALAQAADPSAEFLKLWQMSVGQAPADAHTALKAFAKDHAATDFGLAAQILAGIALLRDGTDDAHLAGATALFQIKPPADPSPTAARQALAQAAKAWAARAQMLQLTAKLKAYYAREVRYPPTLDALVKAGFAAEADITDPFGKRFEYEAKARKTMPKIPQQVFSLRCTTIAAAHTALPAALNEVNAPVLKVKLVGAKPEAGDALVRWVKADGSLSAGEPRRWTVGEKNEDLLLIAVRDRFALVLHRDVPKAVLKE